MFKLQSPSKYSIWYNTPMKTFFSTAQSSFLKSSFFMPFSASAILCVTSSTLAICFPVRTFFHPGKQKKSCLYGGWLGSCWFLVKNYWKLSVVWAGVLVNHPSWNGQMCWVIQKNSLNSNTASHNNAGWYTDTEAFLEHSPSGGIL